MPQPAALAACVPAPSTDTELIRLAQDLLQSAVQLHRCDHGLAPMPDDDYEAEEQKLCKGARVLAHMHPTTMEGLLAKARLVRVEFERMVACDRGQTVETMGERHERLAWSLMNDLLDVTGTANDLPTFTHRSAYA